MNNCGRSCNRTRDEPARIDTSKPFAQRPLKTLTTLAIHRVDQPAYRFEFRKVSEFFRSARRLAHADRSLRQRQLWTALTVDHGLCSTANSAACPKALADTPTPVPGL
jgi:hypothetical protein